MRCASEDFGCLQEMPKRLTTIRVQASADDQDYFIGPLFVLSTFFHSFGTSGLYLPYTTTILHAGHPFVLHCHYRYFFLERGHHLFTFRLYPNLCESNRILLFKEHRNHCWYAVEYLCATDPKVHTRYASSQIFGMPPAPEETFMS